MGKGNGMGIGRLELKGKIKQARSLHRLIDIMSSELFSPNVQKFLKFHDGGNYKVLRGHIQRASTSLFRVSYQGQLP